MKKIYTGLLLILLTGAIIAQVPQGFNYQALAMDGDGVPLTGLELQVRIAILKDEAGKDVVWEEEHTVRTNDKGLFTLMIGDRNAIWIQGVKDFSLIDWSAIPLYIRTMIYYKEWHTMGVSQLLSVPYAMRSADFGNTFTFDGDTILIIRPMRIGSSDAGNALLAVTSMDDTSEDPLFEVKRKDGQTVFAVYNDAVNIYLPSSGTKAAKGGFAIGSFEESKAGVSQDFFRVTPDSVRIYFNSNPNFRKGTASKGGFAIGSFEESKGITKTYLNVTSAETVDTVGSRAQILWYPKKEAFLAGRVHIGSPDSVGQNSTALGYHSVAMGNWSQAFGYEAKSTGNFSTAVGNNAKASGSDSYALGSYSEATGTRSFALGSVGVDKFGNPTGRKTTASSPYSVAIGMGAQATTQKAAMAIGTNTTASGFASTSIGYNGIASNSYSVAIGYYPEAINTYTTAIGYQASATGQYSTAVGYKAKAEGQDAYSFGSAAEALGEKSFAIGTYGLNTDGTPDTQRPTRTMAEASYTIAMGMGAVTSQPGAMAFGVNTTASGANSTAIGYGASSAGNLATSMGYKSQANGDRSIAIGSYYNTTIMRFVYNPITRRFELTWVPIEKNNIASDEYSIAFGNGNTASRGGFAIGANNNARATGALAMGHTSTADSSYSVAIGSNNYARGINAFAIGESIFAESANSIVVGYNNLSSGSYNRTDWVDTDPLFVIGNGGGDNGTRSNAMTVTKNGRVGLQTVTVPSYALELPNNASIGVGYVRATGYANYSDSRVKSQFADLPYGLNEIMLLKPLSYFQHDSYSDKSGVHIDGTGSRNIGLIAQDVFKIIPEVVSKPDNETNELWSMSYDKLVPVLIKGMQEQQSLIEAQQKEIEELKALYEALKTAMESIVNK